MNWGIETGYDITTKLSGLSFDVFRGSFENISSIRITEMEMKINELGKYLIGENILKNPLLSKREKYCLKDCMSLFPMIYSTIGFMRASLSK